MSRDQVHGSAGIDVSLKCTCASVLCMTSRIHVIVQRADHEAFKARAASEGRSLSEWLRQAGRERLERTQPAQLTSAADLSRFFAECDARETGLEPDWHQHLAVAAASRRSGLDPS